MKSKAFNLEKTALTLCGISVIASLYVFVFSMPHFKAGLWLSLKLETLTIHALSAFCAASLSVFLIKKPRFCGVYKHPLIWPLLLICLISALTMPFHPLPIQTLYGSGYLGEGLLRWLDWTILTAAALILCRFSIWRKILGFNLIIGFLAIFGLCVINGITKTGFAPYLYPDFSAMLIIALPAAVFALIPAKFRAWPLWLAVYASLCMLMLLSENLVGVVYAFIGAGFFFALWYICTLKYTPTILKQHKKTLAVTGIAITPLIAITALMVLANLPFEEGYYTARNEELLTNIVSRGYLMESILAPVQNSPVLILTGQGWGMFGEILSQNLPIDWLDFTKHREQWDGLTTDHFHSHNTFIELFYSIGVLGTVFYWIYVVNLARTAQKTLVLPACVFAGGLAMVSSFWFIVPLCVPFLALASGFIARRNITTDSKTAAKIIPLSLLAAAFLLITSLWAAITFQTNAADYEVTSLDLQSVTADNPGCVLEIESLGNGGFSLADMLRGRTRYVISRNEKIKILEGRSTSADEKDLQSLLDELKEQNVSIPGKIGDWRGEIESEIPRIHQLYCQSNIFKDTYAMSNRMKVSRLIVRGEILIGLDEYLNTAERSYYAQGWKDELIIWLDEAPVRSDLAVPYLSWNLLQNRDADIFEVASKIYNRDSENPVGLWFTGIVMLNNPASTQTGIMRMRTALENGIERFLPVDANTKKQLLRHRF